MILADPLAQKSYTRILHPFFANRKNNNNNGNTYTISQTFSSYEPPGDFFFLFLHIYRTTIFFSYLYIFFVISCIYIYIFFLPHIHTHIDHNFLLFSFFQFLRQLVCARHPLDPPKLTPYFFLYSSSSSFSCDIFFPISSWRAFFFFIFFLSLYSLGCFFLLFFFCQGGGCYTVCVHQCTSSSFIVVFFFFF